MNKYIFCDLDATLLNDEKEISNDDLNAIREFESHGNHFIICSGRVPFALRKYKELLNSTEVVSSNGSIIISDNKYIKDDLISKDILYTVVEYALKNNIYVRLFSKECLYILNDQYNTGNAFLYPEHKYVDEKSVIDIIEKSIINKAAFSSGDIGVLKQAYKDLSDKQLDIELAFSASTFLEINSKNQSKGNGVLDYCKYKNIDIKDTIAVGDNENDISMLKIAGLAACPKNASEEVKNVSDIILDSNNNHSPLSELIRRIDE